MRYEVILDEINHSGMVEINLIFKSKVK